MKMAINSKIGAMTLIAASFVMHAGTVSVVTVKADNFQQAESPWDMAFLKDGTMFFTEKCKGLSVRLPSGDVKKLLGVGGSSGFSQTKDDLFCDGQAGVQGVAVDPDFASNGLVYLYSSSRGSNRTYEGYNNVVMRMKVDSSLSSVSDLVEIINDLGYKPRKSNHPFGGPGALCATCTIRG